jgi:dipeptidyl aminopeptidase/acylaminoacyl peptidase
MKKGILVALLGFLVVGGIVGLVRIKPAFQSAVISPLGKIVEKPLDTYTIDALSTRVFPPSAIIFDEPTATASAYTVHTFHFSVDGKKVSGVAHVPRAASSVNPKPVIIQFRGYVDREKYTPGEGTRHSAEAFASNGFISLAPDFLGYGTSDMPSEDVFEERFQTYTTALALYASVATIPMADSSCIGFWGHSNGGQIALTILEILHTSIPTVLWAPVSKPFPYSILYYTDDITDHGKALRVVLAKFERNYDVELYSLPNYLNRIVGPLEIHQGGADVSVPRAWSDELVTQLEQHKADVTYYVYPGADHNMLGAWNTVVSRSIEFYRRHCT